MVVAILLLFPALLINLDLITLINDESIRGLVAMEMIISGNYITPTIIGDYYYRKPPLFNWILMVFYRINGGADAFTTRLATVIFLLIFAGSVFHYMRKYFDRRTSFLVAFALITCGRILFYDSWLGLIDVCFSWVIFLLFMTIYHQFGQRNFYRLFLISYFLSAIAFLLKGLPALAFQAFTLLGIFIYKKEFKRLFHLPHFAGIGLFALILGGYYYLYNRIHKLSTVFSTILEESAKRTAIEYGIGDTILHLFTFPFEIIYHFLPWTLFIVFLWNKEVRELLRKHDFLVTSFIIFLVNIPIYWLSVEVYPRYLFMFTPILFALLIVAYRWHEKSGTKIWKGMDRFFLILAALSFLGSFTPYFLERIHFIPNVFIKAVLFNVALALLLFFFFSWKKQRVMLFVILLLVVRTGFNVFVMPDRDANDWGAVVRTDAKRIAERFKDEQIVLHRNLGEITANCFYVTNIQNRIVRRTDTLDRKDVIYIVKPNSVDLQQFEKLDEMAVRYLREKCWVVKAKSKE